MLKVQFDGDVLKVRPDGPITNEDVVELSRTADDYLATHRKIIGVMVHTRNFPGFATVSAFADYARFIADHHARVRRLALVTDSALAPIAEFAANHVVGLEMRRFPFAEEAAALAWLRTAEFLPGIPIQLVRQAYEAAPGNEMKSGKFNSPESSAALVANVFGFFLARPTELPPLRGIPEWGWPPISFQLEEVVHFPWRAGRHPCLDVLVRTGSALIGVESKRYEPFRSKPAAEWSDTYWQQVWGDRMSRYQQVRDELRDGICCFRHLDAAQLVKHALALRTAANDLHTAEDKPRDPVLLYLHAEPDQWPDGRAVPLADVQAHRREIVAFADLVVDNEVRFVPLTYRDMLRAWDASPLTSVREHVAAVRRRYDL